MAFSYAAHGWVQLVLSEAKDEIGQVSSENAPEIATTKNIAENSAEDSIPVVIVHSANPRIEISVDVPRPACESD